MKKIYNFILCFLITFNMIVPVKAESSKNYEIQMKQDILTFMLAYQVILQIQKEQGIRFFVL